MKNDPSTSKIPVIVVIIVDQPGVENALGADEYLVKPADKATLLAAYFQLAYLPKTLTILELDGDLLEQAGQAADARYRSGMGSQQDLLQAQLQKTKLLP